MAVFWAAVDWAELVVSVVAAAVSSLTATPAGVLMVLGVTMVVVGWVVRKRKDRGQ